MPIEPSSKIPETRIIRRGENTSNQQRKKPPKKEEPAKGPEKARKVDIKI